MQWSVCKDFSGTGYMNGVLDVICQELVANEHLGQHPPVLHRGISFVYGSRHLYILYCIEKR